MLALSSVSGPCKVSVVVVADLFVGYGGVMGGVRAAALLALIICSYMSCLVGRIVVVALMEVVRASFAVVCNSGNGGGGCDNGVVADLFVGYGGGGVRAVALLAHIIRSYMLSVVGQIVTALTRVVDVLVSFTVFCGGGEGELRFADLVSSASLGGVLASLFCIFLSALITEYLLFSML